MSQEYVFRFLSARPASLEPRIEQRPMKLELYDGFQPTTTFRDALSRIDATANPRAARLVAELRQESTYVDRIDALPFDPRPGIDWAQQHVDLPADDDHAAETLGDAYGVSAEQFARDSKVVDSLTHLADTLLAQTITPAPDEVNLDSLSLAYKILSFALAVGRGSSFPHGATVGDLVGRRTILVPPVGKVAPQRMTPEGAGRPQPPARPDARSTHEDREALVRELERLQQTHSELTKLAISPEAVTLRSAETDAERIASLESQLRNAEAESQRAPAAGAERGAPASRSAIASATLMRPVLTEKAADTLSSASKQTLSSLSLESTKIDPVLAVRTLERRMNALAAELPATLPTTNVIRFAGVEFDPGQLREALGLYSRPNVVPQPHFCEFQAGIGDLLIVRQTLKAYELAEFSNVENVLAGETRDREHRRLDTSEDITTTEQTTDTQKEKDLQSTQRNEMQAEADKTVKQQFGLEAGLQISGSYGPSVQFSTHLNANFSTSSEETQRKAVSFSQEVTQKTSETIRETIKQTVSHRVLEEIQEINKHSFVNETDKHIRGIYRWLNKVYDAQIFNYGQRMLYEFVVPEPAAYFLYAMVENPPPNSDLVKPDPPKFFGQPLKPSNLTRTNFYDYVAKYQVSGVPAPPPQFQTAAFFDKQDAGDKNTYDRSGKIDVPDGYETYAAVVAADYSFEQGDTTDARMSLGGHDFDHTGFWGSSYSTINPRLRELSIAYHFFQVKSFTLAVDVLCQLTDEGFAKWQQQAYDSIIEAYLRQKSDYEEKLAAIAIQSDPGHLGRNPAENQRITQEELKKLVLMVLTGSDSIALDSFLASDEPLMDLAEVCDHGSWIRFFENAFEWTNMIYVLYPYFWGRHARWNAALHFTDPDLEFAAFLRAGAARVQVPVRPGFEKAVAHFCQYGEIWNGNDPPLRGDDLYVPIVDEIEANLGKFTQDGVPYPDGSQPWEVRIPTDLVLVENVEEVPNIRDMLTGQNVTLHS